MFPRDRLEPVGLPDGAEWARKPRHRPFLLVLGLTVSAKN